MATVDKREGNSNASNDNLSLDIDQLLEVKDTPRSDNDPNMEIEDPTGDDDENEVEITQEMLNLPLHTAQLPFPLDYVDNYEAYDKVPAAIRIFVSPQKVLLADFQVTLVADPRFCMPVQTEREKALKLDPSIFMVKVQSYLQDLLSIPPHPLLRHQSRSQRTDLTLSRFTLSI